MSTARVASYWPERRLTARVRESLRGAAELLGQAAPGNGDLDAVQGMIAAVEAELERADPLGEWRAAAAAQHAELERLRARYETRFASLREAEHAVAKLREITIPATILSRAPAALCEHSRLCRVLLSLVQDGFLVAHAAHFCDDEPAAARALEALRCEPVRLGHPLVEVEVLRRHRATIVAGARSAAPGPSEAPTPSEAPGRPAGAARSVAPGLPMAASPSARVHQPLLAALGGGGYVAAPLLAAGEPFGALHAAVDGLQAPDVLDADVVWLFARGLGAVYEAASLRRSLRRQRERMRAFVEWLSERSLELSDTTNAFSSERPLPDPPGGVDGLSAAGAGHDDAQVFAGLLTARELEVLRLLAGGASNAAIASALVISEATVKFHVRNLLRKLRASSRAGAVARYYRLVRPRRPHPDVA